MWGGLLTESGRGRTVIYPQRSSKLQTRGGQLSEHRQGRKGQWSVEKPDLCPGLSHVRQSLGNGLDRVWMPQGLTQVPGKGGGAKTEEE